MKRIRTSFIIVIGLIWCFLVLSTQAQESDAQKMLLDSIRYDKLDVAGVKTALGKGANPNWVSDTKRADSVNSVIAYLALAALGARYEGAEGKAVEILQILFGAGAKLQWCDKKILFYPIAEGWLLFTEVLLKNGADPTREIDRWTPMEVAVKYGQAKIVELLKRYGAPPLEHGIATQLIFIKAAGDNNIPRMEEAIRSGANVNGKNRQGETALINAVSSLLSFIESYDTYATIQYLLEKGVDPKILGEGRYGKTTALHCAIENSSFIFDKEMKKEIKKDRFKDSPLYARLIIKALLRRGAFVSGRDGNGMTPLHIAAKYNNIVGAKMLIEAGCKIMPRDDKGKTPLDYAESGEMINLLRAHGAKEN